MNNPPSSNYCDIHNKKLKTFLCLTDKKIICTKCYEESHSSHQIFNINSKIMDDYIFLKYLGKGSSGYIFSVQNIKTKIIYALKIMNEIDLDYLKEVIQEIKIMKSLSHENMSI